MRHFVAEKLQDAPTSEASRLIDFETAKVIPGFVSGTHILVLTGTKPYLNMTVTLTPMIYIVQPDYWKIEVVGQLPGIGLPALGPYSAHLDLTGVTGKKGIEVIGAHSSHKFDIPSHDENIGIWTAAIDNIGTKPQIVVNGRFPTLGEKPVFELKRAEPQGINPTELILELEFGELVDPNGGSEATARYSEVVGEIEFQTVMVRDRNGRKIASMDVVR